SFFFSSRRRHTRSDRDWSSDVCSSDLPKPSPRTAESEAAAEPAPLRERGDRNQRRQRRPEQHACGRTATSHQYPSRTVPSFAPFTDPVVSIAKTSKPARARNAIQL